MIDNFLLTIVHLSRRLNIYMQEGNEDDLDQNQISISFNVATSYDRRPHTRNTSMMTTEARKDEARKEGWRDEEKRTEMEMEFLPFQKKRRRVVSGRVTGIRWVNGLRK
jgi:hypothetical protein